MFSLFLTVSGSPISDTILELEEAFKVLIVRNKVLLALVKKCGGTAPSFTEPKIFNCIVTSPLDESDLSELYVKQNGRPPKNGKGKAKRKLQTLHDDEEVLQKKRKIKLTVSRTNEREVISVFIVGSNFQKKGDKKKLNDSGNGEEKEPAVTDNAQVNEQNNDPGKVDDGKGIDKVVDDKTPSATPSANSESKELKGWSFVR